MITGSDCTHMPAHTQTVLYCRKTNTFPTNPPACCLLPWPFLFRKEDKYPHNGKSLPLMHFQQSTAPIHVFTYKSEFICRPPPSDLFPMVNGKISGAIAATAFNALPRSPAWPPLNFSHANGLINRPRWPLVCIWTMRRGASLSVKTPTMLSRTKGRGLEPRLEYYSHGGVWVDTAGVWAKSSHCCFPPDWKTLGVCKAIFLSRG